MLTFLNLLLCLFLLFAGCAGPPVQETGTGTITIGNETTADISAVNLLKTVTIPDSRRPKIAATDDRVFVVYADTGERSYKVKIFDRDMETEIASRILVTESSQEGSPTDIRIASDDEYLYTFYETADGATGKTHLFGARYELDDSFARVGYTGLIATGRLSPVGSDVSFQEGDEKLDDPIPLIGENSVFAITRYHSSIDISGKTCYKVYEFTKELEYLREFDLDLSSVADGRARQSSAMYYNNHYYMVLPTTVGEGTNEFDTPADILLVKFDTNWNIIESHVLSTDHQDVERYMTGFEIDGGYLYLAYNLMNSYGVSIPLKIFDMNYNLVLQETLVKKNGVPDIEVADNRIFIGISSSYMGDTEFNSDIYIYEIVLK